MKLSVPGTSRPGICLQVSFWLNLRERAALACPASTMPARGTPIHSVAPVMTVPHRAHEVLAFSAGTSDQKAEGKPQALETLSVCSTFHNNGCTCLDCQLFCLKNHVLCFSVILSYILGSMILLLANPRKRKVHMNVTRERCNVS